MPKRYSFSWIVSLCYKRCQHLLVLSLCSTLIVSASFATPSIDGIQIYQKNLEPEHRQKLADDIIRYRNADNLWDVLKEEFALDHYENNPAVQEKIEWYMNNQDYLLRSATRAAPYLYYILQQVKKRHLPAELVLLPIIESGYNPFSVSNVGATGIWQLMPDTASGLGVKQDWWFDGRRDVISSTRGALNYLAYLQTFFDGNWLLAIAAYNTGEGNVLAAIRHNIRDGRNTDFWSLPVAQQTRDYVPSLLALAVIISHPDQYPIYFPPVRNAPYLAQVDIGTHVNLTYAAKLAGISFTRMKELNPGFNRPTSTSQGPSKLVLPIENVEEFTENLASSPFNHQTINWMHYRTKTGDTLTIVARKFDITVAALRKLNRFSSNATLHLGMDILIPSHHAPANLADDINIAAKEEKTTTIQSKVQYTLQPGDTLYMVRNEDTLARIATRFHLNADTIMAANNMQSEGVKPGEHLLIPTHATAMASNTANGVMQSGDILYLVRHGDTIEKIAKKFHLEPAAIRLTNLADNNSLAEGERLVIPTHLRG